MPLDVHTQDGVSLVEAIVAALVLSIVSMALLSLLIGTKRTTVGNRDRLAAATLAETDQERLRATPLATLSAMASATPTSVDKTVGGVAYTVRSSAKWVNDGAGFQPTCTSGTDGTADYLRITSTVKPRSTTSGSPEQSVSSLLSPKASTVGAKGTLSVPFLDRDGRALSGTSVTLAGAAASGTAVSNGAGCAVFSYFPTGSYTATFSRSGYVLPSGETNGSVPGIVNTGRTNFTETQRFDRAATVTANVVTLAPGATTNSVGSVLDATVGSDRMDTATNTRVASSASRASSFGFTGLFPFSDGYFAYAGDCPANNPTQYGVTATTVATNPAAGSTVAVFAPTLAVRLPGYNFKRLVVAATDSGCDMKYDLSFNPTQAVNVQVPFGTYRVCIDDGTYSAQRTGVRMGSKTANTLTYSTSEAVTGKCV